MKSLVKKYLNMKIRSKILLSYIFIITLTVTIISAFNYSISVKSLTQKSNNYSEALINEININFENSVKNIEDIIFIQYKDSALNKYLSWEVGDYYEQLRKNYYYNNILFDILYSKPSNYSVTIFDKNLEVHHLVRDNNKNLLVNIKKDEMEELRNYWGRCVWVPGNENVVFMKRALYDPDTTYFIGYMIVGIDKSYFSNIFSQLDEAEGELVVLNKYDEPMLYYNKKSIELTKMALINKEFTYQGEKYISNVKTSINGNWKTVNIIPMKTLTRETETIKYSIVTTCLISMLIALFIGILISNNISENVKLLLSSIKHISEGNFNTKIKSKSKDEIGLLADEFNIMSGKIIELMDNVYKEKELSQNAKIQMIEFQYNALQAQINPHFLYNTLETINSMAKIKGEEEISNMVCTLGELFRQSINRKSKLVKLKDEIGYINNYLSICKFTYGGKINIVYELDENLNEANVPNFILQPIIENSISHGIGNKIGVGTIIIRSKEIDDNLILEIEDDGIGIEDEKIKNILNNDVIQEEGESKHFNVGLQSVIKRIELLYGGEYGVQIKSIIDKGTLITLFFPLSF